MHPVGRDRTRGAGLAQPDREARTSSGTAPLAADLEQPEVLVPVALRGIGLRLLPPFQGEEIFSCDPPLTHAIEQMVPEGDREIGPLRAYPNRRPAAPADALAATGLLGQTALNGFKTRVARIWPAPAGLASASSGSRRALLG